MALSFESSTLSCTMSGVALQNRLQDLSSEYQKLQGDLSEVVEARQRLDAQLSENELVKKVCVCASGMYVRT